MELEHPIAADTAELAKSSLVEALMSLIEAANDGCASGDLLMTLSRLDGLLADARTVVMALDVVTRRAGS